MVLVPKLVNAPVVLSMSLAGRVGGCLYFVLLHRIGPDRVMWSSGHPHQKSMFGYTCSANRAVSDATTAANAQKILGKTAIEVSYLR